MKITLPLLSPSFDDDRISEQCQKDFEIHGSQIYIYNDVKNWLYDDDARIFSLWIEYGKEKNRAIMFDVDLDDLEIFAASLLKSIEMVRRDYSDVIKQKKINYGKL